MSDDDRSDPTHTSGKYGQWYTREQIIDLFAPSAESIAKVKDWLIRAGVAEESIVVPNTKGWVHFDSTVGQLESLVKAEYHIYNHISTRGEGDIDHLGTDEYHLPEEVAAHVDFIVPGTAFGRLGAEGAYADGRVVLEARAAGRCVLCRWRHSQIPVRKLFSIALAAIMLSLASSSQPRLPSRLKAV